MRFSASLLVAFALVASATATPLYRAKTIVDVLANDKRFTSLVAAVSQYPDLVEALSSPTSRLTVFAPLNSAFAALPAEPTKEVLKQILSYHVAPVAAKAGDLSDGQLIPTLYAEELLGGAAQRVKVSLAKGVQINAANVVEADIKAEDNVIHAIDSVLLPPANVIETGVAAPQLSTLVAALKAAGLVEAVGGLKGQTALLPTNEAFAALPEGVLRFLLTARGKPLLTRILEFHVLPTIVYSADIPTQSVARVPSLLGPNVRAIRSVDGKVTINDNTEVVAKDVLTANGVVHVINKVLLPTRELLQAYAQAQSEEGATFRSTRVAAF